MKNKNIDKCLSYIFLFIIGFYVYGIYNDIGIFLLLICWTAYELFLKEDVGRLLFLRLLTAKSIIESAINRKSSIGAHYIKEN